MIVYTMVEPFRNERLNRYAGAVIVDEDGGIAVLVSPETAADEARREQLFDWAQARAERFWEGGPDVDGAWIHASDGSWQSWARLVSLPPLQGENRDVAVLEAAGRPAT